MPDTLDPKDVEAFLRAHPNFLQDRPGLLAVLNLPHGGEGAVSLVERQVSVLRERNIASRQKLAELSDIGRENDRLLDATRNTIIALLAGSILQKIGMRCEEGFYFFGVQCVGHVSRSGSVVVILILLRW